MALSLATPALAHADLVSADPADGAVLATPPTTVTLTFSEGLDATRSSFKLSGPEGSLAGTGTASGDGATTMTLDGLDLAPGAYTVKWTSASLDNHLLRGTFAFTVSPPASTAATAETSAPATDAPRPSATPLAASPAATAAAASPEASAPPLEPAASAGDGDVVVPILVALVLVALVGAYVLRRSRST